MMKSLCSSHDHPSEQKYFPLNQYKYTLKVHVLDNVGPKAHQAVQKNHYRANYCLLKLNQQRRPFDYKVNYLILS